MPEPIITPVAQRSSSPSGCQPASSTASAAAAMARLDEAVHLLDFLGGDILRRVELAVRPGAERHLAGDFAGQVADVEGLDGADPRLAGEQPAPDPLHPDAEGTDDPHASDDHAAHRFNPRPVQAVPPLRRRAPRQAAFCFSI